MRARPICQRCVLPESPPELTLDARGVCNVCQDHEAAMAAGRREPPPMESDFYRMIKKYRGKGDYDCLVMCSGGKDSTSALYYMKTRYKMNPLAFTFDHGFETEDALTNVHKAVEKLGVDYLQFRSTRIHGLISHLLHSGSKAVICHLCSMWYMELTFSMAARFRIPLIIAGWTKGQSTTEGVMSKCACNVTAPEFKRMGLATVEFLQGLEDLPGYEDFPRSMEEVLKRARKKHKAQVLSPHWFLPTDPDEYVEVIKRELDWEYPQYSYPGKSTNCYLNYLAVHNSMRHYGYTHYHVEMSKMIRANLMTRDEALELLDTDYDLDFLNGIAAKLDYQFTE